MTYLEEIAYLQYFYKQRTFTHFSGYECDMQKAIDLQLHYVVDQPKVDE